MHLRSIGLATSFVTAMLASSAQAFEAASISYTLSPGAPGGTGMVYGGTTGRHTATAGTGYASVQSGGSPVSYGLVHAHTSELTSNPDSYSEPSASIDFEFGYSGSLSCSATAACASAPAAPSSPFLVSGYVGLQVAGLGSFVSVDIGDAYGVSYYCVEGGTDCGVHQFSYGPSLTGTITPGTNGAYTVNYTGHMTLYVAALANTPHVNNAPSGDAYGYADPLFTYDPTVLAAGFTAGPITLSDGIANASAPPPPFPVGGVPEPASWALLIAGFGLTGTALRRRTPAHG